MGIKGDMYNRNLMPNLFATAVQGKQHGDARKRKDAIKGAFDKSIVTDEDGNKSVNENMLLSNLAEADHETYMQFADTVAKRKLAAERAHMNEALNIGKLKELQSKGYLADKKVQLEEKKFRHQQTMDKAKLNKPKKKTYKESQFKAAGFAKRAIQGHDALADLISKDFDPTSTKTWGYGLLPKQAEGYKSENVKLLDQSKNNFISAVLRRESGAAISDAEYEREEAKYFPAWGDSGAVLQQKAAARQQAIENLKAEAGGAFDSIKTIKTKRSRRKSSGKKPSWAN